MTLLTRTQFREAVFARDKGKCVFCDRPAVDAHHIMERRLWPDGGYYLDNGASVCEEHHLMCEQTAIDTDEVRRACNISKVIFPPHLYPDQEYDKWGNPILENGTRLRGELFEDESVQKVLPLELFVDWIKYPRTYHLPWSDNLTKDDRMLPSLDVFIGQDVIVTEKMDGENTTLYTDYIHARSVDGNSHPSRDWVKNFWSQIKYDIPKGWRICGENLYAKHSIHYTELSTYFMGFSIWNDKNICLSWDETLEWFKLLGITPAPVLYKGKFFDDGIVHDIWDNYKWESSEGYVMRLLEAFHYKDFKYCVGKYVRKNHVQTVKHWMHGQPIEANILK